MEIKPETITPEYAAPQYTPCGPWIASYDRLNPWQVVWNQISFAPDPYQQMFNFQNNRYGPGLQRRTYKFDPDKTYNITLQQSDEYAYFTYGGFYDNTTGSYVPIQYVGTTLNGVLGSDLGATSIYDYVQDYPNGLYHNDSKYRLRIKRNVPSGTEITMSVYDGQETINYHTRVETPTFTIENDTNEDTLLHYYSREIEFRLNFQQSCQLDGYGGAYPEGIKFNVEIVQGQEYGNLYYPSTVADPEQSGTSITNLEDEYGKQISNYTIKYKADGIQPEESNPGIVTIRCTANDADIAPVEVSFPVKYNTDPPEEGGIILVNFNKESFYPGDTATTNCKWLTAYNELLDFPAEQSFNVVITGGSEFGMLLDPNTGIIADNLQGVSNGFKVMTATSIPYDSVVIRLKVSTSVEVNNSSRMITNQNPKLEIKENNRAYNDDDTQTITPDILIIGGEEIVGFGDMVVEDGDWCSNLMKCDGEIILPKVVLNPVPNGYNGRDICADRPADGSPLEGVLVFWDEDINITTNICYNSNQDRVWYSGTSPLNINYILAICDQNVPSGVNLIDDWTGLDNDLTCSQLEDIFIPMTIYGGRAMPPLPGYYLRVVINAHENEHKIDYQTAIDQALPEFNQALQNFVKCCSDFTDESLAKYALNSFLIKYFKELKRNASNNFNKIKEIAKNRSLDYETDVQHRRSVIDQINSQITAINNTRGCNISLVDYFY
ncbi:Hypothetical protein IALB_3011 [Ignavibacterium album JCM 16511]|uniref:Uncharacterized protein n=1 Tax=Ignavibacterium album (strain DSM 19864 / JCM 16511 / NBRC 101810 / Mat9-16) TaxID=945713 RepID=I0AP07_IGNAJ|nr:hypothetical protein [Ignavibacterium album]AFH50714.1 Hypothetical protein IALB_3011 [Ignavibacterium album JCM 16511]